MKRSFCKRILQEVKVILLLMVCFVGTVEAQGQGIVRGTVTDSSGEPLIGVSILVKGTANGVISDLDGGFSISAAADDVLQFSYVGYINQEIQVGNKKILNVIMEEDTKQLDEVVVVGYGTQKKVNLTGAVSSITSDDLINKPVMSTAQAIAGLAPGLSVVANSGRPGAGASVKIRGTGTFSGAGTDPLVLIDGLSGSIDDVDPNDIQSISFLKDAASASIYGNRAANGVILIETKKGQEGKTQISYNATFGWQTPTELPEFLDSWEYAEYYNMAMRNMGLAEAYSAEQIQKFRDGSDPDNYPNVNHLKWLLDTGSGFQHQHNVSVRGGNERTNYSLSLGYRKQDGLTAKTSNERMTATFSLQTQLTNRLLLNININAYNNNYDAPYGQQNIDQMIGYSVREPNTIPGQKSDGSFGYQDNYSPEAWLAGESFIHYINRNVSASGQLKWNTPIEGLSISGKAGVSYWTKHDKEYMAETYFDDTKTVGPSSLSVHSTNKTYTTFEALVNYDKVFNEVHGLKVLAGTSVEQSADRWLDGSRNTFPNNFLYELGAGDASTATNGSGFDEYALVSFFGRVNYSFKDRYLLEGNLRYDGSSRFAKDNRWGLFPSVSAGWRISEEDFWKNSKAADVFDNLKLRLSYGVLGNQNIGTYPYQQVYDLGHNYPLGNPATLTPGTYVSSYKNVGESNVGAVSNKGIEVNLSFNGRIGKDFRFSIAPNFTWVKNAVEELANGATEEINSGRIVGQPLGIIYGYQTDGLFVDQAEIDAAPEQLVGKSDLKPGYVKYKDISGPDGVPDGKVDAEYDRTVLGSTTPKFYYGLNLSASYKGFDFSALLQGLGGYQRLIGSYMAYAFYNNGNIQRWQADNCWTEENPDKWAEYPRIETLNMNSPNLQTSDYWMRNASFLRIKNVQLGYTFPKKITKKIGVEKLRLYVSGQNLYSFNGFYKGWDPENEIGTGDAPSYYPITAIYSFGINLNF